MVADLGDRSVAVLPDHGRRLIAVVYADMAGYSRLIGLDDASTFERLREMRRDLIDPALARHGGTLVSTGGDSLLVRFDSIIPAMRFAVDVQRGVPDFDGDYAPDRRIRFRMGVMSATPSRTEPTCTERVSTSPLGCNRSVRPAPSASRASYAITSATGSVLSSNNLAHWR
jgi:class 3 adenylate cyclase